MSAAAPPLVTRELGRSYGRLLALDDLSLTVSAGECVALIGVNGSGKSTAVRLIAGLLTPSRGTALICGSDPYREPEAERARAALAVVPDAPLLYEDLPVRQHLELVAIAHGIPDEEIDERIDGLLDRLDLEARGSYLPRELSRGMRQKTQLACALIRPAALLVLDEPVVGLDPPSQTRLRDLLLAAKAEGAGVLMTTHQLRFADGVADRGVVLEEGRVVDAGPWAELTRRSVDRGWELIERLAGGRAPGRRGHSAVARPGAAVAVVRPAGSDRVRRDRGRRDVWRARVRHGSVCVS